MRLPGVVAHEWDRRSVELLPAGVFVWRDELVAEHGRMFGDQLFFVPRPGLPELTEAQQEERLERLIQGEWQMRLTTQSCRPSTSSP